MAMTARADPSTYRVTVKLRETLGIRIDSLIDSSLSKRTKSDIIDAALDAYLPDVCEKTGEKVLPSW